jgi:hypothetical protein
VKVQMNKIRMSHRICPCKIGSALMDESDKGYV